MAGHERCAIRAQPYHGFGDFCRPSKTTDGMATENVFVDRRKAKEPLRHGRFDRPRTHRVDPNPTSSVFQRRGLGQPDNAVFARTICRCPGGPTKPVIDAMFTMAP